MIKKIFLIVCYSFYLFIFWGFVFHTSAHATILGKYTIKNVLAIGVLFLGFVPFLYFLNFISTQTVISLNKKKIVLTVIRKFILLFILFCMILFPIELVLRHVYLSSGLGKDAVYTLTNFHPFLQLQQDPKSSFHINSYGFRGEEMTTQKNPNTYRIFVMGGSTVFNSGVSYEKNVTYLLEKKLQAKYPDKKIEVLNAGVDGYTTEHSLIQYLFYIQDFSPDMIIMWHGINDWYYSCNPPTISRSAFKSDYSHMLGSDALMVREHFTPRPLFSIQLLTVDILGRFLAANLYSDVVSYLHAKNPSLGIYEGVNVKKTYTKKDFPSIFSYERNLISFVEATKLHNVTLLLGNQPFLYSNHMNKEEGRRIFFPSKLCTINGKYPSLASVIESLTRFNDVSKKIAAEYAIPFIDLANNVPKTQDYFTDDVHYTEKGNALISDILFSNIVEGSEISE